MTYRIGTRGSKLAMVQTEFVKTRLETAYPDDRFEAVVISTKGDRVTDRPIAAIGDNALFTREIEEALRDRRIDLAVHSMKDLPATCPDGLTLARAWTREDPRDALVSCDGRSTLAELPSGATVATGSARRNALLRQMRPDIRIVDIRGNVDTRLRKLFEPAADEPQLDAIVLAVAGLKRLGRADVITEFLDPMEMIPAPNQGQLAIELRADDAELMAKVEALGDEAADLIARTERGFLQAIDADCHMPVGAFAQADADGLRLRCVFARDEGEELFFAEVGGAAPEETAARAAAAIRRQVAGTVTLVGAGPGDPELITVKGLRMIETADAIVYDRLVPGALLKQAKPGCELVYVGKASGDHAMSQKEINALLVRKAMSCRQVVRLKGGDSFVFGRGGEEMEYLNAHGVPCWTVPGVTSAVAAAESVGIPVTHRGVASGFEVVTAHGRDGEPVPMDYGRMLDRTRTYVFLMGLARIGEIADGLVSAGRSGTDAVAVISSATTPEERCVTGTLADIAVRTTQAGLVSPAVLVVGPAVGLRERLHLPLAGGRFLVPVIEGGTSQLAERIRRLGGVADEIRVGRIVPIGNALTERDLDGIDRIVLTSRNGWLALDARMRAAAEARGIRVEQVREVKPVGRTLHLTQPDADRIEGVKSIDVYRNEEVPLPERIDLGRYDAAFFTCASSVRRVFARSVGTTLAAAIGPKTAAALAGRGVRIAVAAEPTLDALLEAASGALHDAQAG